MKKQILAAVLLITSINLKAEVAEHPGFPVNGKINVATLTSRDCSKDKKYIVLNLAPVEDKYRLAAADLIFGGGCNGELPHLMSSGFGMLTEIGDLQLDKLTSAEMLGLGTTMFDGNAFKRVQVAKANTTYSVLANNGRSSAIFYARVVSLKDGVAIVEYVTRNFSRIIAGEYSAYISPDQPNVR